MSRIRARLPQTAIPGLWLLAALALSAAAHAGTIAVTTTVDEADGDCGDGDCSLRDAIELAAAGDTVLVPAGVYTLTLSVELVVGRDLTLSGAGAETTIVQSGTGPGLATWRVLHVTSGDVTVSDVTIRHGAGVADGGGIVNEGTLRLERCVVTQNRANGCSNCAGGGIDGGAARGGGIYDVGSLNLTQTSVANNSAQGGAGSSTSGEGGAVYGGGIYSQGDLTLDESTVSGNSATGGVAQVRGAGFGGGIYSMGTAGTSTATLNRSTISANTIGATFGALFSSAGGGIYRGVSGAGVVGNMTLSNSTVSGNNIDGFGIGPVNRGGGLFLAASSGGSATLMLNNVTVAGNTAAARGAGGGLYILADSGGVPNVESKNSILALNIADPGADCFTSGASLISQGHNLIQDVSGCAVTGDMTGNVIGEDPLLGPLQDNGGTTETRALQLGSPALEAGSPEPPGSGGGACEGTDQRGMLRPVDGDGDTNSACDGGAYESEFLPTRTPTSTPTQTWTPTPTATVTPPPTVTPTREALETRHVATSGTDVGPCLDVKNPCRSISYAVTQAIPADTIQVALGSYVENVLVDRDLTIAGASAEDTIVDGGGLSRVFVVPTGKTVVLSGLSIVNGASSSGAGVFNQGNLVLESCILRDNKAKGDPALGGGLYNKGVATLNDCVVRDNSAVGRDTRAAHPHSDLRGKGPQAGFAFGGGIQNDGTASLNNCAILENEARPGSNVSPGAGSGGGIRNTGSLTVDDSLISGNFAVGGEGAHKQSRSGAGGGIATTGQLLLRNVTISGNGAGRSDVRGGPGDGGGLHIQADPNTPGTVELSNTTISANHAYGTGGGIYGDSSLAPVEVRLRNSIVASNSDSVIPSLSAPDCSSAVISEGHNLIGDPTRCAISGDTTGNILGADPLLLPLADNGGPTMTHALRFGSLATEAGSPSLPGSGGGACEAADQRSFPRPADGDGDGTARCDMGAFERQQGEPTPMPSTGPGVSGLALLGALFLLWRRKR